MATGYTADILDGKAKDAKTFALRCSGAFVNSRYYGDGSPYEVLRLPQVDDDSYYAKALAEDLAKLAHWDGLDEEGRYREWSEYALEIRGRAAEAEQRAEENMKLLTNVLSEVEEIDVPDTHARFKAFMIEQINRTMDFDGTFSPEHHKAQDYHVWCETHRAAILRMLSIHAEGLEKENKNIQEGRDWIRTLGRLYDLEVVDE